MNARCDGACFLDAFTPSDCRLKLLSLSELSFAGSADSGWPAVRMSTAPEQLLLKCSFFLQGHCQLLVFHCPSSEKTAVDPGKPEVT